MSDQTTQSPIKFQYIKRPNWKLRLNTLRSILGAEGFSYESSWKDWEVRIQEGHRMEEEKIQKRYDQWIASGAGSDHFDPDEHAGMDTWETSRLTNSMYAAMTVALWAEMEQFLKAVISIGHEAQGTKKKVLEMSRRYCEDELSGKDHAIKIEECIRALREIAPRPQISFDEMKKEIAVVAGASLQKYPEYGEVSALRVLSNAFKHGGGQCRLDVKKPDEAAVLSLLKKWDMLRSDDGVEYAKLPTKELVDACNSFSRKVLRDAEEKMKKCPQPAHIFAEGER